jgi:hypothetical protein
MRAVGNHRDARTIYLVLAAGLVVFAAVLALTAGGVGIPPYNTTQSAPERRETAVAKLPPIKSTLPPIESTPKREPLPAKPVDPSVGPAPLLQGLNDVDLSPTWRSEPPSDQSQAKAFDPNSKEREVLPWDAVEPVPLSPMTSGAAANAEAPAEPAKPALANSLPLPQLPSSSAVTGWLKVKATEIKGEDRARPLIHFELWLEPPPEVKRHLVAVVYDFSTPAIQPQSQRSSDPKTGFRIAVGGLACADTITLTLKLDDGRSEKVAVDGCGLLESKSSPSPPQE